MFCQVMTRKTIFSSRLLVCAFSLCLISTLYLRKCCDGQPQTYSYSGAYFNRFLGASGDSSKNHITISMTLSAPFPPNVDFYSQKGADNFDPTSWSITDGNHTLSSNSTTVGTAGSGVFQFGTDASGTITQWQVVVSAVGNPPPFQDLDISKRELTALPDLSAVVVGGSFVCSDNKLTSLKGAPQSIGESFFCGGNQLKTLEGAPAAIPGSFDCAVNQLTSLRGAPQTVGGDFHCFDNLLTSLEGGPQTVRRNYYCFHNRIETFAHQPTRVGGNFNWEPDYLPWYSKEFPDRGR